jgi:hypothetical protein
MDISTKSIVTLQPIVVKNIRPISHFSSKGNMSITEDGEVIIQLPKHSRKLVISSNGEAITYSSDRRVAKTYNLQNFPQKLYRYYHQASVLVETVKTKTPKV